MFLDLFVIALDGGLLVEDRDSVFKLESSSQWRTNGILFPGRSEKSNINFLYA
jgi:hypothetical protein